MKRKKVVPWFKNENILLVIFTVCVAVIAFIILICRGASVFSLWLGGLGLAYAGFVFIVSWQIFTDKKIAEKTDWGGQLSGSMFFVLIVWMVIGGGREGFWFSDIGLVILSCITVFIGFLGYLLFKYYRKDYLYGLRAWTLKMMRKSERVVEYCSMKIVLGVIFLVLVFLTIMCACAELIRFSLFPWYSLRIKACLKNYWKRNLKAILEHQGEKLYFGKKYDHV